MDTLESDQTTLVFDSVFDGEAASDTGSLPDPGSEQDSGTVPVQGTDPDVQTSFEPGPESDLAGEPDTWAPPEPAPEPTPEPAPEPSACGTQGSLDCWLWYNPSNAHIAGGLLPDFFELFEQAQLWSSARSKTGVFFMRASSLKKLNDTDFIESKLVPSLQDWNLRLALDVGGATWAKCWSNSAAKLNPDVTMIERIIDAGGTVEFLALQSVLSKPLPSPLPASMQANCPPYTMQDRFEDVAWYVASMKALFPDLKIGIIDALLAHGDDAQGIYTDLVEHLDQQGLKIDFILFDHPYHHGESSGGSSWASLAALETYVRDDLGLNVGLYHVSSTGAASSEQQFYHDVIASHDNYDAAGGRPDYHVISSWWENPTAELPEDAPDPSYPLTKVLDHMGTSIIASNRTPMGHMGTVNSQGFAQGWALDKDNPSLSIRVELYLDGPKGSGQFLGSYLADTPRPDVNEATGLPGDHGYKVSLPAWLADGEVHLLYAYAIDSRNMGEDFLLTNGPREFQMFP